MAGGGNWLGRSGHAEMPKAKVILFKETGKYYTEEEWEIPFGAIGPYDMLWSKDFRRIGGGPVLVITQEPWGYPHILVPNAEHRFTQPPYIDPLGSYDAETLTRGLDYS